MKKEELKRLRLSLQVGIVISALIVLWCIIGLLSGKGNRIEWIVWLCGELIVGVLGEYLCLRDIKKREAKLLEEERLNNAVITDDNTQG